MTPLRQRAVPFALLLAAFIAAHAGSTVVYGATLTVDTTIDAVDANPGDGVCDVSIGLFHGCTLRAAIMEANALPGLDVILLPTNTYVLAIAPTTPTTEDSDASAGDLDLTDDLGIFTFGPVSTIWGGLDHRIFHVHPRAGVTISGVLLRDGRAVSTLGGGAILNQGQLALLNSVVQHNVSNWGGGGIANRGVLSLINSTITNNASLVEGGGIVSSGTLMLISSTVSSNTAHQGDAAAAVGGGISNREGVLQVIDSTVSRNRAGAGSEFAAGGGIFTTGTVYLTNSTIAENEAGEPSGRFTHGGGIYNQDGTVSLASSTVSDNLNGGIYTTNGAIGMVNTIIAQNHFSSDCVADGPTGVFLSLGHNLDGDNTCSLTQTGDLAGVLPVLGPLQNNGGRTETVALLTGSPAINGADNASCPPTDQRGVKRPQGPRCDIGAYELEVGRRTRRDP